MDERDHFRAHFAPFDIESCTLSGSRVTLAMLCLLGALWSCLPGFGGGLEVQQSDPSELRRHWFWPWFQRRSQGSSTKFHYLKFRHNPVAVVAFAVLVISDHQEWSRVDSYIYLALSQLRSLLTRSIMSCNKVFFLGMSLVQLGRGCVAEQFWRGQWPGASWALDDQHLHPCESVGLSYQCGRHQGPTFFKIFCLLMLMVGTGKQGLVTRW